MAITRDYAAPQPVVSPQEETPPQTSVSPSTPTGAPAQMQGQGIVRAAPPPPPDPAIATEDQWTLSALRDDIAATGDWYKRKAQSFASGLESMAYRGPLNFFGQLGDQATSDPETFKGLPANLRGLALGLTQAKELDRFLERTGIWVPPVENPTFGDQLASGAGSMAGFMAGGAFANTPRAATLLSGVLGGVSGGGLGVLDAEQYGASEAEQTLTLLGDGLFGASEALTGGYFLTRLNRASGGQLFKTLEKAGLTKTPTMLDKPGYAKEIISGFLTEAAQEGFQTGGENWVAKMLYDPEREIGAGVGEAALVGGVLGGVMGGAMVPFQRNLAEKQKEERRRLYEALLKRGGINDFGGAAMSLFNLPELKDELRQLDTDFKANADEAYNKLLTGQFPQVTAALNMTIEATDLDDARLSNMTTDLATDVYADIWDLPGEPDLQKRKEVAKLSQDLGKTLTVMDLLTETESVVVTAEPQQLNDRLDIARRGVATAQKVYETEKLKHEQKKAAGQTITKEEKEKLAGFRSQYSKVAQALRRVEKRQEATKTILRRVSDYVQKWAEVMDVPGTEFAEGQDPKEVDPAMPVRWVVTAGVKDDSGAWTDEVLGMARTYVEDSSGTKIPIGMITINPNFLLDATNPLDGSPPVKAKDAGLLQLKLQNTVLHELGHIYADKQLRVLASAARLVKSMVDAGQDPDMLPKAERERAKAYLGILMGYRENLNKVAGERMLAAVYWMQERGLIRGLLGPADLLVAARLAGLPPGVRPDLAMTEPLSKEWYFSQALRSIQESPMKSGTGEQWLNYMKKQGVKAEEFRWTRVEDFFKSHPGKISKDDLVEYLKVNQIKIEEAWWGEPVQGTMNDRAGILENRIRDSEREQNELEKQLHASGLSVETSFWGDSIKVIDRNGHLLDEYELENLPGNIQAKILRFKELHAIIQNAQGELDDLEEDPAGQVPHSTYQLKGYVPNSSRIVALKIPAAKGLGEYISHTFVEHGNIVVWVRFNEQVSADGKRVLMVEEIQSDLHQQGRKKGYEQTNIWSRPLKQYKWKLRPYRDAKLEVDAAEAALPKEISRIIFASMDGPVNYRRNPETGKYDEVKLESAEQLISLLQERIAWQQSAGWDNLPNMEDPNILTGVRLWYDKASEYAYQWEHRREYEARGQGGDAANIPYGYTPPELPYGDNGYLELAMKRMIRYGAEHGFDSIAWTPAIQQVHRWSSGLRSVVNKITWVTGGDMKRVGLERTKGGTLQLDVGFDGIVLEASDYSDRLVNQPLADIVGGKIAEQILAEGSGRVEGANIVVGDKGFRKSYDDLLVGRMRKYLKKWGGQVEKKWLASQEGQLKYVKKETSPGTWTLYERQIDGTLWQFDANLSPVEAEEALLDFNTPPKYYFRVKSYYSPDGQGLRYAVIRESKTIAEEFVPGADFATYDEAEARIETLKATVERLPPQVVAPDPAQHFSEEWVFDLTPEMRKAALAGVPHFQRQGADPATVLEFDDPDYALGFEEYLAHRMERLGARAEMVDGKPVFKSDLDRVMKKHFFSKFQKLYQAMLDAGNITPNHVEGFSAKDHPYDQFLRRIIVADEYEKVMTRTREQGEVSLYDLLKTKGRKIIPGLNPEDHAGLQEELDNFNRFQYVALNLLQIARRNPHTFLKVYEDIVANEWSSHGRVLMKRANDTLQSWRRLGKEASNKVTNVLMEETLDKEPLTPTELKTRLTPAETEVYYRVRDDLAYVLAEMERISRAAAEMAFSGNKEKLTETLAEIDTHFSMLRGSGYFPLTRHGKHLLIVRADKDTTIDGKRYKAGDLVHWEGFDYEYERNKAGRELRSSYPHLRISVDQLSDTAYSTQGIPLPMLRLLRTKLEESGAPGQALQELDEAIKGALPLNSFHRKFLKRRGIAGFSQDFQRSYAKYMSGAANHMSRVEAGEAMRLAIAKGEEEVKILHEQGRDARKRSMMVEWAKEHYQYLMSPANELQGLRSFGFLWYLGFHIKSAAVNLTQPLITGYPYMAERFGDAAAVKHMILANKDITSYWTNRTEWTQAAMKEAEKKFAYVQEVAPGEFVMDGLSNRFDLAAPNAKFFNLSGLKVANTNHPDTSKKLIEARLKQLKRAVVPNPQLQATLEAGLSAYEAMPGAMTTQDFDNMDLAEALPEIQMDVVVLAGPGGETIVRVPHRLLESRQIKSSEAHRRQQVQPGDVRGELMQMIQRGQAEGWLDQSLAMELAIAASENKVDRLAPIHMAQRAYYKVAEVGSLPFHAAEKLNRLLMAISAYRAAREEGLSPQMAEKEARECVRLTMYEHTNWNRPVFMRGKKSIFFLFMNYVQNTAYIATQGDGNALRLWLVLAFMSGLAGLPFAEDLEDLIDYAGTKLNEALGTKNPKVQIRQEARQLIEQTGLNPDLILHGFAQNSFGLPWVTHHLGFGAPSWDLSTSISMGDIIPGTELPGVFASKGSDYALSTALREFGGAAVSAGEGALRASASDDPNDWKRLEKFMPAFARSVSKSVRYGMEGGEASKNGDVIARFDPFAPRDFIELLGQAGGFTPSRVTRGWEQYMAERELVQYYKARGQALTKEFSHAVYTQDREYQADVWKAIQKYNASVPYPEMSIGWTKEGKNTLAESVIRYVESQTEHKLGKGDELKYRRLVDELRAGYKSREVEGTASTD